MWYNDGGGGENVRDVERFDRIFEEAKNNGRHAGTYKQAVEKSPAQLNKSIRSHEKQVTEHQDKINNPVKHYPNWEK